MNLSEKFSRALRAGVLPFIFLLGAIPAFADPPVVPPVIQRNFDNAETRYKDHPADAEAAWKLGLACFDRAEFSKNDAERARLAREGMSVCEKLIAREPKLAAGHYYLAMNIAQLARTKLLGALPLLSRMAKEWDAALQLAPNFDYGGPDRYLGLLYRDAPGWPMSLGDNAKARKHLKHSLELSPNFPENYLNLAESYLTWSEPKDALPVYEKLVAILPAAHKEFSDEYWAESWKDWNDRAAKLKTKLEDAGVK